MKTLNSNQEKTAKACINDIIRELYFKPADDTYIVARWCGINRLSADFIWNAIHALEKYMKAAILFNGGSVKHLNHDIKNAYCEIKIFADRLLPTTLNQPQGVKLDYWPETTPLEFIEKLLSFGGAAVRYNERGYVQNMRDLFLLDELVFHLRRLCHDLDRKVFARTLNKTQRDILIDQPDHSPKLGGRLEKIRRDRNASDEIKQAAFNMNIRFRPKNFDDMNFRSGTQASNSVLGRRLINFLQSDESSKRDIGLAIRDWYFSNNKVDRDIKRELSSVKKSN